MRQIGQREKPFAGQNLAADHLKYAKVGRITRVDYERGLVDLSWLDSVGERTSIPLPSAYSSARGSIRGMPEIGSVVVCGWIRQTQTLEQPIILGFLDVNYQNAIEYRLSRNNTSDDLTEIAESIYIDTDDGPVVQKESSIRKKIGYKIVRSKRRKIYPGEIQAESTQGSELYLHDDVYLSDKSLDEFEIVSADKSIRFSSRQQYSQTAAARISNGLITREPIEYTELFQPTVLPNGQRVQFVTQTSNPFHLGGKAFTEYRIETYETSSGRLNVSEVNSGFDITPLKPFITFLMGTTVGNDKTDVQRYSKIFRPQVFSTPDDIQGKVDELECLPEEIDTLAGSFQLKFHKSGSSISIDKQGHLFTNFAASTNQHPLGGGRSWEGKFDGSIKLLVGANVLRGQSIIINTKGSIYEHLGVDLLNFRSKETIADKAIYTEVLAPDKDGNAYIVKTSGHVKYDVAGSYFVNITGDYIITVNGKIQENIMGTKTENYIEDKNNVYGANYKELIIKRKESVIGTGQKVTINGVETEAGQPPITNKTDVDILDIKLGSRKETLLLGDRTTSLTAGNIKENIKTGNHEEAITIGNHKETITTGDSTTSVKTGNIKETITTGDHTETIKTGNHKESITTGDHSEDIKVGNHKQTIKTGNSEVTIKSGDFKVAVTAGNVSVTTKTGNVTIKTSSGKVNVEGMMQVTVKSGVKLVLSGPQVEIGSIPTRGGVIVGQPGVPSHLDFICGIPLIGSKSVKASI
jgi:hypothetical protein